MSRSVMHGSIKAPPSKAYTHRTVIAAGLSFGESVIKNPLISEDTQATLNGVKSFGAIVAAKRKTWTIQGQGKVKPPQNIIDCGESGATLRFLAPIMACASGITILTGKGRLLHRPQGTLLKALRQLGVKCYSVPGDGNPPLILFGGGLGGGKVRMRGDVSSQYISGLLFAAPYAATDIEINVIGDLESKPYVDITIDVLKKHSIKVQSGEEPPTFSVHHHQKYKPSDHQIEGDYSSAAFLLAAAAISGSKIRIENLSRDSLQGDKEIIQILKDMSLKVIQLNKEVQVQGNIGQGAMVDATHIPDLVPVVAVLGCFADGKTVIRNVERLRYKESDRIRSIIAEIRKMGIEIQKRNSDLIIDPKRSPRPARFESHYDHRIAMACCVAALGIKRPSKITNSEVIRKSYPSFIDDLKKLGVEIKNG
ncbi:3-phosphoshikimate 1-carboxyvinyltransferase [[Eubacterium] cellulosolvens]